jgi:glycosyltransferase involved in cell wall biosynthesis
MSVVLPSHNRAACIGRAITSILAQDFAAFELLVIDDASTDNTVAAVQAIADPRLGLWQLAQNSGAPAARNAGIAAARSDIIVFQDSDDEWRPGLLAAHHAALQSADVSFCQLDQRYGTAQRLYPPAGWQMAEDFYVQLLAGNMVSTQTLAARRDALLAIGGFDPDMPRFQDWDLVLRLAAAGKRFHYTPQPLAVAHDSPDSLTRSVAKGIIGRQRVIAKHQAALARHPALLARHHHIMGTQFRQIGDHAAARAQFAAALRLRPLQWRSAAQWGLAALGR